MVEFVHSHDIQKISNRSDALLIPFRPEKSFAIDPNVPIIEWDCISSLMGSVKGLQLIEKQQNNLIKRGYIFKVFYVVIT